MAALRIGFLTSHGGSAARAVAAAIASGRLDADIRVVIANNSRAAALAWAAGSGVATAHISAATHGTRGDAAIRDCLRAHGVGWVVLSGYLRPVGPLTLAAFRGRMLNVHPALLPDFGGRGMYGDRVHEAVLAAGMAVSGATVHLVDEAYDHGAVVARRQVPVLPGDDVPRLRVRVMAAEAELLVETLARLDAGDCDPPRLP